MLENLYTTKMSANKKALQKRFGKIRSKNGKLSKSISVIMAAAITITMIFSVVVMALVDSDKNEQYKTEVLCNTKKLEFVNKPCFKNNTLYLPLQELLEKTTENSKITNDNDIITITFSEEDNQKRLNYIYRIQKGKAEYTLNPEGILPKDKRYKQIKKEMELPPEDINGVTYIPFEYVDCMINRVMQTVYISYSVWDTAYNKNTDREADFCNDDIAMDYFDNHKNLYTSSEYLLKQFVDWPCENGTIAVHFGDRIHPVTKEVREHNGVDIMLSKGEDIKAASDGTVLSAGFDNVDGNYVVICSDSTIEGHSLYTIYKSLGTLLVNTNDKVKKGDVIGKSGLSGTSTGPHLHFELKLDDTYYDPEIIY